MAAYIPPTRYRLLFIGLSLVYLFAEFGFNASLLDLAGGLATPDEVSSLERYGRTLSGVAAVLLAAKWLMHRMHGRIVWAFLAASPLLPAVYIGQGELIDRLVAETSGAQRQIAAYAALVPSAVLRESVRLQGLPFSPAEYATPASKTFFAIFPALAYLSPDIVPAVDRQLEGLMRNQVAEKIGSSTEFYNRKYVPAVNDVKVLYNKKYVPASNAGDSPGGTPSSDAHWEQYQKMLRRHGIDPLTAERHTRDRVIAELHRKGLKVSDSFELTDRDAFDEAVAAMGPANRPSFSSGASKALGFKTTIGPGLSWSEFAAHKDVQKKLRAELNSKLPAGAPKLTTVRLDWSPAEVHRQVYAPTLATLAKEAVRELRADSETFAPGGVNVKRGEEAVRRVLVPPIALSFSLFFSLMNLLSLILDCVVAAANSIRPGTPVGKWTINFVRVALLSALVIGPLQLRNSASESQVFRTLASKLNGNGHEVIAAYLGWVIKAEPMFYPIARIAKGDVIRR